MLSRLGVSTVLQNQSAKSLVALALRTTSTTNAHNQLTKTDETSITPAPRLVRLEPGKVRMGFIPEEWFQFFHKKTGVTGPYVFAVSLSTYLCSKEIYVMEHEYYTGLSLIIMWTFMVKKLGPKVAAYLDKEVDSYEGSWKETRQVQKDGLNESIAGEEKNQWSLDGQLMLTQAKRDNVGFQLEANYRERLIQAYSDVKKRLDYQVEKQNIERRIAQKNLIDYVVAKVRASITPDQEKQNINKCIADLSLLGKA